MRVSGTRRPVPVSSKRIVRSLAGNLLGVRRMAHTRAAHVFGHIAVGLQVRIASTILFFTLRAAIQRRTA